MKKLLFFVLFFLFLLAIFPSRVIAIEDPTKLPNNRFGIHILFPDELKEAAKLVNSQGGDWGYVTIPIQATDKNLGKWQQFMDTAKRLHLIPIIRIATEGDYFKKDSWRKPNLADVLDFAIFLNSLDWPTKNRYIIIFNEVNRGDEWGGEPAPSEYAEILQYAVSAFKSRNEDFFIISSGLDNAAPNQRGKYMSNYAYMQEMDQAVPGIFSKIDGLSSHSYPNPGFKQPVTKQDKVSVASFLYERQLAQTLGGKTLPVFITETGWSKEFVADSLIASYYKEAFETIWNKDFVVTVTPFLLRAHAGPFTVFSFITNIDKAIESAQYTAVAAFPKVKGTPSIFEKKVLSSNVLSKLSLETKDFRQNQAETQQLNLAAQSIKEILKWLLKIES